jgi:hypothetical protein
MYLNFGFTPILFRNGDGHPLTREEILCSFSIAHWFSALAG